MTGEPDATPVESVGESIMAYTFNFITRTFKIRGRKAAGAPETYDVPNCIGVISPEDRQSIGIAELLSLFGNSVESFRDFVLDNLDNVLAAKMRPTSADADDVFDTFFESNPKFEQYLFRDDEGNYVPEGAVKIVTNKKTGESKEIDVRRGIRMSFVGKVNAACDPETGSTLTISDVLARTLTGKLYTAWLAKQAQ